MMEFKAVNFQGMHSSWFTHFYELPEDLKIKRQEKGKQYLILASTVSKLNLFVKEIRTTMFIGYFSEEHTDPPESVIGMQHNLEEDFYAPISVTKTLFGVRKKLIVQHHRANCRILERGDLTAQLIETSTQLKKAGLDLMKKVKEQL